jgi:hypothetical protein
LLHLKAVIGKSLSQTRFGAASTPPSGTSFFKVVSKDAVSCHTSSLTDVLIVFPGNQFLFKQDVFACINANQPQVVLVTQV